MLDATGGADQSCPPKVIVVPNRANRGLFVSDQSRYDQFTAYAGLSSHSAPVTFPFDFHLREVRRRSDNPHGGCGKGVEGSTFLGLVSTPVVAA